MFQGIRELSTALSVPFGTDEVDFLVNEWMMSMYARMFGILEVKYDVKSFVLDCVQPLVPPVKAIKIINMYAGLVDYQEAAPATEDGYQRVPAEESEEEYSDEEEDSDTRFSGEGFSRQQPPWAE